MPDLQEVQSESTPEQRNSGRAAELAKASARALAAAVEEVTSGDKEPEKAPEPSKEPDPTPQGEPPTEELPLAAETAEEEPEKPAVVKSALSDVRAIEARARRAKQMRERARERDERSRSLEAQLQQNNARLAQYEERERRLREQPFEVLAEQGVDMTKAVPDWLNKTTLTDEQKRQVALEENQKRIEQKLAQQELIIKGQELQARQAAFEQSIAGAISDRDAFEYVHQEGGVKYVFDTIVDHYNEKASEYRAGRCSLEELNRYSREDLNPAVISKALEAWLEQDTARRAGTKKFAKQFGEVKGLPAAATSNGNGKTAPAAPPPPLGSRAARREKLLQTDSSRELLEVARGMPKISQAGRIKKPGASPGPSTLSDRSGGIRTVPYRTVGRKTEQEAIQAAVRMLEQGNAKR
jgi:hypothetical protein